MSNKQKNRETGGVISYLKRAPFLLGLALILVAVLFFGGRSMILSAEGKTADTTSGQSTNANVTPANNANKAASQAATATVKDGVQYVTSNVSDGGYEPITVQQGIPVKWTLNAPNGSLNGCNSSLIIPEYNLKIELKVGENLIEFTPDKSGTFAFSCWMGMIRSSISVVGEDGTAAPTQDDGSANLPAGCCGGTGVGAEQGSGG